MTDAKPADGTYYFAEFGLRSKGAPPMLYRSRIVGEVHYDEFWDVRDHVWSDTNVLTDYKYGHGDNNLVALTDEQAEPIRLDGVEWFHATQRWTVHYRKVDETPSEVRYEFFTAFRDHTDGPEELVIEKAATMSCLSGRTTSGLSHSPGGSGGSGERVDEHVQDLRGESLLAGVGVNSLARQGRS